MVDVRFGIVNLPEFEAKMAAHNKILGVRREMLQLNGPLQQLLKQLVHYHAQLTHLLSKDVDTELGNPVARLEPFQIAEMHDVTARWEEDPERACAAAMTARRRLILAVHHATILVVSDMVGAGEDFHYTLLMLVTELHERLFG